MSILDIKELSHMYDDKMLFDGASLVVNNGEHAGVVGLNGAGKTTFMNILAGKVMQDSGEVKWTNGVKWGYLDQHADIDRAVTVMQYLEASFRHLFDENVRLEGMYAKMCDPELSPDELDKLCEKSSNLLEKLTRDSFFDLEANIKKVANGIGVGAFGYDTLVKTLSGGQRAKLMLAKLLLEELDLMMLDEPTNFLDVEHVEWLSKYLDSYKGTFLVISHDTGFLNKVCKLIISVENRTIKKYSGNYDSFLLQREGNMKQYEENYARQQAEIKKHEDYIARNRARAATAGMANSRKKLLEKMDVLEKPTIIYPATFSFPYTMLNTKNLLEANNLSIGYTKVLLENINMHLKSGDKLWIRGTNGIGKSTLLKTLMAKIKPLGGDFEFHINSRISYLEQDLEFISSDDNAMGYIISKFPKFGQKEARNQLAKVGIKNDLATKPICNLSGGEQVRVKLCERVQIVSNVLILDEPTNHLDINAKASLLEALQKYEGSIILVSHEQEFASQLCNEIFDM